MEQRVLVLTEAMPPFTDGVASTVQQYLEGLQSAGLLAGVALPRSLEGQDPSPYHLIGYPTIGNTGDGEFPIGFPVSRKLLRACREARPTVLHVHTPFMSMLLARRLRRKLHCPIVLSYHVDSAMDINRYVKSSLLRRYLHRLLLSNINAADEIWISDNAAAHKLREIGYTGGYYVTESGTNLSACEPSGDQILELRARYNISYQEPILLVAERLVWHPNLRLLLDCLHTLHSKDVGFRLFVLGDGPDRASIEETVASLRLDGLVHFVGTSLENERLIYHCADLHVATSPYHFVPQAVKNAAQCSLPTLAMYGSASYEILEDGVTGLHAQATANALSDAIMTALADRRNLRRIGQQVKIELPQTWVEAMAHNVRRYKTVVAQYWERSFFLNPKQAAKATATQTELSQSAT